MKYLEQWKKHNNQNKELSRYIGSIFDIAEDFVNWKKLSGGSAKSDKKVENTRCWGKGRLVGNSSLNFSWHSRRRGREDEYEWGRCSIWRGNDSFPGLI